MLLTLAFPVSVLASENSYSNSDLNDMEQGEFEEIIEEILDIKAAYPEYTDEMILKIMDENHQGKERGIIDIWNMLTDSEKKLCIRYPFDEVNTAKNIAASQTEAKFGSNGLGDRSDAFRHGIWNAEMTVFDWKRKGRIVCNSARR